MNKKTYYMKIILIIFAVILVSLVVMCFYFAATSPVPKKKTISNHRLELLTIALSAFYSEYGKFPAGNNIQITAALLGDDEKQNPEKIKFLEIIKPKKFLYWNTTPAVLDTEGNYLDAWENSLLFELNSETGECLIKSFGANKKDDGGKKDDIEIKKKVY